MARKPSLTPNQQAFIVDGYVRRGMTQTQLARLYGVSPRTIQRVLISKGYLPERQMMNEEERRILELLRKEGITTAQALAERLDQMTEVNTESVLKYLVSLPVGQFWAQISRAHLLKFRAYRTA